MRSLFGAFAALSLFQLTFAANYTLEAESGVLVGTAVESSITGFSGTGYVGGFDEGTDSVTVSVNVSALALYDLSIRYHAPYGDKKSALSLNGAGAGEVSFVSTTTFTTVAAGKVLLQAGVNTLTLTNDWGWYFVDAFYLSPSPAPPPHKANLPPVDALATSQAKSLLRYIQYYYGKKLLSGQQEPADVAWLEQQIGVAPAISGFDFMDYSPSRVERGTVSYHVENATTWDKRGGIVDFVWHWNAPSGLIDVPGQEWWRGFYTTATTFDVAAALANKTSTDYKLLLRDIDAIAVQIKRLSNKKIPILFRPLHEASGGWFWWGAKGPAPAKELYRLVYKRITEYHKLHNLIWIWNSVETDWYPGDDVVDILSFDSYPALGDHGPVSAVFDQLVTLGKDRKPIALGEVGGIPDPALLPIYHADWSFFVTWGGDFIRDNTTNPLPFVKKVYTHPTVLTLKNMGNYKSF